MVIYKITNLLNKKVYIGKNKTNELSYMGSGILLKRAIKKYGIENFIKEIIDTAETIKELNEKEIQWISFYESRDNKKGYNIASGGDGGDTLSKHPNLEELRHKFAHGKNKGKHMPKGEESNRWISLDVEKVIFMYVNEKKSLTEIVNFFKVSKNKIARTLTENNVYLRNRKESCLLRKKPSAETRKKMSDSHVGEKNAMKGKSVYEVWVQKYGIVEADKKMNEYKTKMSKSLKDSNFNKGNKHYSNKNKVNEK